jgi:hypothetical protein
MSKYYNDNQKYDYQLPTKSFELLYLLLGVSRPAAGTLILIS